MAEVRAAGGVIVRDDRVLLVHRAQYDDWSLPKGKLEEGETWSECALREVAEETGLDCELGEEVGRTYYLDGSGRDKEVRYFRMTAVGEARAQNEIDELRWVPLAEAGGLLSYERDVELVGSLQASALPAPMELGHVLVVGAGQMGGGIAQVVAASGRSVSLYDSTPGATDRALEAMKSSLERLAEKGGADPAATLARVTVVADLVRADLLIEAIVEDAGAKEELFRRADAALPSKAILASNTSSIPIGSLAAATSRPDRVIGMHFFNPVPVLALVEVVCAESTSAETAASIVTLARELGKEPVEARDVAGFVSNRILMPFINEAVQALADGVAGAEAIDTVARLGFGHPIGPLALADLIGLDTCVAIMEVIERGLGEKRYAPHPLLREHVAAGQLGRKSGRGFYDYG